MSKYSAGAARTNRQLAKQRKAQASDDPNVIKGEVPEKVLDELVHAKTKAKDFASAFADAIKAQAAKYGIKPAALRRFVTAKEADKLDETEAEINDLTKLIDGGYSAADA